MTDAERDQRACRQLEAAAVILATLEPLQAATAVASLLAIVRDHGGHVVRDHAYRLLRENGLRHRDAEVQLATRRALDELEQLARPVDRPPVAATPRAARTPPVGELGTMQPGRRYRIAEAFHDFDGTRFPAGAVLTFESHSFFPYDDGHTFQCREATIRLSGNDPAQAAVIQNSGDRYVVRADV